MGQISFAVYDPPEKGMPFLAVRIDGVKTKFKMVRAVASKTRAEAESAVEDLKRDLHDPQWRERAALHAAYSSKTETD